MTHLSLHSRVLYLYFSVQIQISIFAKLSRIQNISWINSQYVAIDSFILSLLSRVIWFLSVRVSFWCRHRKQTCGYRREGEGGVNWESNIETYTLCVREHLTGGFPHAVFYFSRILCSLSVPVLKTSRAACSSQDWGHRMRHAVTLFSVSDLVCIRLSILWLLIKFHPV